MPSGSMQFDLSELCPPGALENEEPDEIHFMEATGNEGASFERTYRRAAIVLWPSARRYDLIIDEGVGISLPYLHMMVMLWQSRGAKPRK